MNAEELAERFRTDRARLVEAAPLIDRAFGSVMASFAEIVAFRGLTRRASRAGITAGRRAQRIEPVQRGRAVAAGAASARARIRRRDQVPGR